MATSKSSNSIGLISIGGLGSSQDDYQVQDDLRTLSRAAMIRKDKKRMAAAMKLAREQISTLEGLDPSIEEGEKDD